MKKTIHLLATLLFILPIFPTQLIAQPAHMIMRGQEGDICYEAEVNYREHRYQDHVALQAYKDYMNCLAGKYTSGQANLYEIGRRVHHNEVMELLSAIAWIRCPRSSPDNCVSDQIDLLFNLDSDQDGIRDLDDDTPLGGTPPPDNSLGDQDGDGVPDNLDECDDTPTGWNVNSQGCPQLVLEAQPDQSFYEVGIEEIWIRGTALAPDEVTPLQDGQVYFMWDGIKYYGIFGRDGAFEIKFTPMDVPFNYEVEVIAHSVRYREIKPNSITLNFSVRPGLSISLFTDKDKYVVGENIQISGKVSSLEPIGSDLDIYCEIRVLDPKGLEEVPYRLQRVHLSSDGSFSYEIPIYGPDEPGKWQESGALGNWWVIAEVNKGGNSISDAKSIQVYRHHVDMNKATREYWAQKHAKTTTNTQSFDRPSHGESILLGPNTEVTFTQSEKLENLIRLIDGEILYLKDMRQKLSAAQQELLQGNPDQYISLEGNYTKCTSVNSSYILEVDPVTGTDKVTVFYGPVVISSPTGQFPTFQVEHATEVLINAGGIQEQRSLSKSDQWAAGEPFVAALGGTNPADLRHTSDPYADELDPNYQPGLVTILQDYARYIIGGVVGLVVLILIGRRIGKGKTKVAGTPAPAQKEAQVASETKATEAEWESARFCTNCGNAMPKNAKFCPSCGAKRV
jgi:hypothetical protein